MASSAKANMILLPFGEDSALEIIKECASELAVVMIEPVMGPMTLPVDRPFLQKLREVTRDNGVLLLFDEVITGFRLALGGGQERFNVVPDLAIFGKALGSGMPIGAIGCSKEILDRVLKLDPPISIAGTFSGNAMTVAAADATLSYLMENPQIYSELDEKGIYLRSRFNEFTNTKKYPATMTGLGSMWQVHMISPPVSRPRDRIRENAKARDEFATRLRLEGIFLASPLHLAFLSPAHSHADIEEILRALSSTLDAVFS
jgi:glutamate-1-semialdehyde 2,1-aminomutase